jgi:CDP-glucose 4,6-dehydratase
VLEPVYGYLLLAKCLYEKGPSFSGAWNFGPDPNEAKPVRWIAEHMIDIWGYGAKWHTDNMERPHEESYLTLDCSKARSKLGWEPRLDLYAALEKTVRWYKTYYAGEDMYKRTVLELKDFEKNFLDNK